ncbi:MAG TPA: 30S ribosomal protein S12 methylthiotransferase RimO [Bacteroidota bacterium]
MSKPPDIGKKPRISVVTLGCSKNIVDSERLLGQLRLGNASMVDNVEDADIAVINTCGFIDQAKQESIDAIVEAVERKQSGRLKKVVVMGCLSERYRADLQKELPDVDAYFGSDQQAEVLVELGVDYRRELLGERLLTTPSHFAYLKISEGCDRPCSFCAIPLMRGGHKTRPFEEVVAETQALAAGGVKELIVIGQDTTYYGLDLYNERRLAGLLDALASTPGLEWIRLMYAYPAGFPRDVIPVIDRNSSICKYIDLPLQHASDSVLKSMRRGVTERSTRELLEAIKTGIDQVAIRTTFIVGYPNETEADFQKLYDLVREMKFHRLGVFTYSHEEGTFAEILGDPVPSQVKEERRSALMDLQKQISEDRNEGLVGSRVRILVDRHDGGHAVGRTQWDAPEIDQEVYVKNGDSLKVGNFYDVTIVDAVEYDLYATAAA